MPGSENPTLVRLQTYLRSCGVESRRGSEKLIESGRVRVNGAVVTVLGSKIDPSNDVCEVDGEVVTPVQHYAYLILNKPAGYVSTMDDPQGRPCVAQLVPTDNFPGLYHVGRLDRATRGLLLFTNDGEMGEALLHPRGHVEKTYLARVEGTPTSSQLQRLRDGVLVDGAYTAPAQVQLVESDASTTLLRLAIHEGRNRQVRKMCAAIRHRCLDLQRISFGPLCIDELEEGKWRHLTTDEVAALKSSACKEC